jgi:hypothetical protein
VAVILILEKALSFHHFHQMDDMIEMNTFKSKIFKLNLLEAGSWNA